MSNRHGVDLASYQGLPGQWEPAAGKIGWAAVKVTELQPDKAQPGDGRYVNPDAAADWQALKARRRARIAYLYARPGTDPALAADFFVTEAGRLGLEDGDGIAVDLEVSDGHAPAQVAAWAGIVLEDISKRLGRVPLLYTYLSFAWDGNCAGLGKYPLWISDPSSPAGRPRVPAPWKTWAIHQYGTSAPIDRDIIAWPDTPAMTAALGKEGAKAPRKQPVRKVARKAVRTVVAAGGATSRTVRAEPVLTAGTATGALTAVAAFWLPHLGVHLTATGLSAVVTAITAVAGALAAVFTRPVRVTALAGMATTLSVAAAMFGYHLAAASAGTAVPVISLLASLLLRAGVSPKPPAGAAAPDPAPAEAPAGA